jgi:hypothetical protein
MASVNRWDVFRAPPARVAESQGACSCPKRSKWPSSYGHRCFYCASAIRGEPVVDHFVPWSRYPLDLGHNYELADARCNGDKADRLAAFDHLRRWVERDARPELAEAFETRMVPFNAKVTHRVGSWAYEQAARAKATIWERGRDGLVKLDHRWRSVLVG